jgi:hypothetical protein
VSPLAPVLEALGADLARLTERRGKRVEVGRLGVTDRTGQLELGAPGGIVSPNGACRLFPAADGWMALNLAREEDRDLIPAWLACDPAADPWAAIAEHAPRRATAELVERAALLGLPAARVGEVRADSPDPPRRRVAPGTDRRADRLRVLDLSALWAGPMCGAILAAMGAEVVRVHSLRRPDPTAQSTPEFFRRLNGEKAALPLDLTSPQGQVRLEAEIARADVLITGFRPRALGSLGLEPGAVFEANPGLVWVAVTGYGWTGPDAERVAFGDDAAAAGGLLARMPDGEPRFLGDALADPVTGLAAALAALQALEEGGGQMIDAALARCAARAAARLRACDPVPTAPGSPVRP